MSPHTHVWIPFLLAAGVVAASSPVTRAAEEPWEQMPNGVMGQPAMFDGADGVKIAGYVRKPAGAGPFPIVIILHGEAPRPGPSAARPKRSGPRRWPTRPCASNQLGHATHPPLPDFLAQGWAIYSIDYRTNPRYTLDPREWDDTLVAVNKARSFSFVDPKRMAMMGGSHGGHVTGRMISRTDLTCA